MRQTLISLLDDFRTHAAETAVVQHLGVRRYPATYGDILTIADRFALELIRRSVHFGDRVVLWGANSRWWVGAMFGCIQRGVIAVPLDAAGSPDFARRVLAERDPDLRYVVRELHAEFLAPLQSPGTLLVELTAAQIGRTSATYRFRCARLASGHTLTRGHRVIVKVDKAGRPAPWSPWYREVFSALAAGRLTSGTDRPEGCEEREEGVTADASHRRPAAD